MRDSYWFYDQTFFHKYPPILNCACLGLAPVFVDTESWQAFIPGLASIRNAHIHRKKLVQLHRYCADTVPCKCQIGIQPCIAVKIPTRQPLEKISGCSSARHDCLASLVIVILPSVVSSIRSGTLYPAGNLHWNSLSSCCNPPNW
jgi:hypothetical protein